MKKLILLSIIILSFSCNRSIYYEYSNNGSYATLEIKDEFFAIYRSNTNNFIYTKSAAIYRMADSIEYIDITSPYWLLYIDRNKEKFDQCGFDHKIVDDAYNLKLTYKKTNEDSIVSISKLNRDQFLENGSCFTENKIDWLPPYFTRVKKIDYTKFNLPQIEDKYLKNPIKAPKVYDK